MKLSEDYAIGTAGVPWGEQEKTAWLAQQVVRRSYQDEVLNNIELIRAVLSEHLAVEQYGLLDYASLHYPPHHYPLYAFKTKQWQKSQPSMLITGGVHGYETSGVQGALSFVKAELKNYHQKFNFVVAPCISPWGYETINRWNPNAIDPNRSFNQPSESQESAALMMYLSEMNVDFIAHIDLHETTDTDNSEFRPALAARDAKVQEIWNIPDGFYCVGDSVKPVADFQAAIINSVEKVTHIAEADANNKLIGTAIEQRGVINYPTKELGLCAGFTNANYVSTTEVYPDSPRVDDANCTQAQVAAIVGALDYLTSTAALS